MRRPLPRVRRLGIIAAVVAGLTAVSFADHRGWLLHRGAEFDRFDGRTFTVTRVHDGDTIVVRRPDAATREPDVTVRLWGIDTPETAGTRLPGVRGGPTEPEPGAAAATALTRRLALGQAVVLHLERHRVRGRYRRVLAYVELPDGTSLNERLLAAGLAVDEPRWAHRYEGRYRMLRLQAQHDGVGLWADDGPPPR